MLKLVINKIDELYLNRQQQPYLAVLYKALFAAAYYGLLRISEVAVGLHPVLGPDVHVGENKKKLLFILRTSKTRGIDSSLQMIKIEAIKVNTHLQQRDYHKYCPFELIEHYISIRPSCKSFTEPFLFFQTAHHYHRSRLGSYFISCYKKSA